MINIAKDLEPGPLLELQSLSSDAQSNESKRVRMTVAQDSEIDFPIAPIYKHQKVHLTSSR